MISVIMIKVLADPVGRRRRRHSAHNTGHRSRSQVPAAGLDTSTSTSTSTSTTKNNNDSE